MQLNNNDYGVLNGSPAAGSASNVSVDPHFAAANDGNPRSDSPALNAGWVNLAGGLPMFDIEGHAR